MKLPRTPLTDLAELMLRHPRVLNYRVGDYSDLKAELVRLIEFIGMIAELPFAIIAWIYRPRNWW